ncbi:hypothetical protein JCM10908_003351 [Rhodotorula pacifica]|uniref:uncharacterized protein n=1 Tax=Rhodotorula pacifica TaxID=1495444 RepID=UPI00317BC73B
MSCEFKADLLDLPEGETRLPVQSDMPLKGDWFFEVTRQDTDSISFTWLHGILPFGQLGLRTHASMRLDWLIATDSGVVAASSFGLNSAPQRSEKGGVYRGYCLDVSLNSWRADRDAHSLSDCHFRLTFIITRELDSGKTARPIPPFADLTQARRIAKLGAIPPTPLRLIFPKSSGSQLSLWITTSFLAKFSKYHKDLLASGCAETQPHRHARIDDGKTSASASIGKDPQLEAHSEQSTFDWQDSDDEADEFLFTRDVAFACEDAIDKLEYRQITTRETAFSTFRAVLLYLQMKSGEIRFAPLQSALAPHNPEAKVTREQLITSAFAKEPDLPLPVSPKSVFRLAHLMRHAELQNVALGAFAARLTVHGAASELFSPISLAYDELRKLVIDYIAKNWKEVRATESWKVWRAKAMGGEVDNGAQILGELLDTV